MSSFLESARKLFVMYQQMGEKAMAQVADADLYWQANEDSNSIAIIVKHLWGNMLSRWTDFLTTDGEKPWRQRDEEFEQSESGRDQVMKHWNEGWECLHHALASLTDADLEKTVVIRNEEHTVTEAISRQLCHYASHVGQIVFIAKMRSAEAWKSLSIPRNKSAAYNQDKFAQPQAKRHFTDEWVDREKKEA